MAMPTTFQQLLNNMLPPKVVGGVTYVPRLSWDGIDTQAFNAIRSGRTHGGIDVVYGKLNPDSNSVIYIPESVTSQLKYVDFPIEINDLACM